MAKPRNDIPIAFLAECFALDPATPSGLRWRTRPREHFPSGPQWCRWNTRFAGRPAETPAGKGYLRVHLTFGGRARHLRTHRVVVALTRGDWPSEQVDHIHGVEAGNGLANLREATNGQNQHNRGISPRNTSGFRGVCWHKQQRKWQAQITIDNRIVYLGLFDTCEEASAAYLAAKAIVHPFQPVPRGMGAPALHAVDRMKAARHIVRAGRRLGDSALELTAWDAFADAM